MYRICSSPIYRYPLSNSFLIIQEPLLMNVTSTYSMILNTPSTDGVSVKVDFLNLKKGAMILRSLNHKLRQQIIRLIDENKRMTVTEIYVRLRLEQSVASQHLAILRKAGFVTTIRDGKFIYYSVNHQRLQEAQRFAQDLLK